MATPPVTRCFDALHSHDALAERNRRSGARLDSVREALNESPMVRDNPLAIFCAGSLARMESGRKSDLDLFVTAEAGDHHSELRRRLFQITLFSELMAINQRLGFPPFGNDGEYLKVYFTEDLTSRTGSPSDDSENATGLDLWRTAGLAFWMLMRNSYLGRRRMT